MLKKIAKKVNIDPVNLASYVLKNMSYNTSKKISKFAGKIFKFGSDAILPGQIDLDLALWMLTHGQGMGKRSYM